MSMVYVAKVVCHKSNYIVFLPIYLNLKLQRYASFFFYFLIMGFFIFFNF